MKIIQIQLVFAFSAILFSCSNEVAEVAQVYPDNEPLYSSNNSHAFDQIAAVMNLEAISNLSPDNYVVRFIQDTSTYDVVFNSFDPTTISEFDIDINGVINQVILDMETEEITINGLSQDMSAYERNTSFSDSETLLNRIIILVSIHHGINSNTSYTTPNGGGDDVPNWRFFGHEEINGPCQEMIHVQSHTDNFYILGIQVYSNTSYIPC